MNRTLPHRTSSLLIALLAAGSILAQNPLPNPGFEEWVDGKPVGWTTNNNQFTGQPVSPNASGHSGASAGRGTYLGLISAPIINTIDASSHPLPITQAYQRLTFYYQLQLASTQGTELFSASAIFTNASGATVGYANGLYQRTDNTSTWTYANLPVTYTGSDPVGVNVNFGLNGLDAVVGSYFVVDDVALEGNGASGVQELEQGTGLGNAWPVPATETVNLPFTLDRASTVTIDVLDALGRMVDHAALGPLAPGRYKQVFDVQGWSAGTYTAVLRTTSGAHAQALVVGH
ncbi:MAG: hypothetical protein QM724_05080 [Flavobacteriales bacterium]